MQVTCVVRMLQIQD